jgi:transposase
MVTLTHQEYIALKWKGTYWETLHARACEREDDLKEEIKKNEALIRDLKQRLYGKTSEKGGSNPDAHPNDSLEKKENRARGQQKGSAGHGRTQRPNLPIIVEVIQVKETACGTCGLEYSQLPEEESDIIEIEVAAHIRRVKRQKCVKNCTCTPLPKIITAPVQPKLIPKSPYGNSIWITILLNKFLYAQPMNRTLQDFKSLGFILSSGTADGGLKKLTPLFEPIYELFHKQQMKENRFHNDETRWEVYQQIPGKIGHRWYLWLMRSASVVYYRMDPTRSADVPIAHFADLISKGVIIVCDRYSAYKKLAKLNLAIILAFCWAHVRRDFLDFARAYTDLKEWGLDWAEEISTLFHLNNQRVAYWDPSLPLGEQSPPFQESHKRLGEALRAMKTLMNAKLLEDKMAQEKKRKSKKEKIQEKDGTLLTTAQRKVLTSLQNHWKGLTVFYEHPEVKMDNNPAEQSMRNPVLGRNGYYGSGSLWSAELAAMMFSIFQTMIIWDLNPRTWLTLYFEACAQNRGKPPEDLSDFLPWRMSEARLQQLSRPPT